MIPRILHHTHSSADLPAAVGAHLQRVRDANPDWDARFYDERDRFWFILRHYNQRVASAYNRIHPLYGAARADFFRYLLVYEVGGVYLDLKAQPTQPLDAIVANHAYLLSCWDNEEGGTHPGFGRHWDNFPCGEFQIFHIAAVPRHPFLKAVIDKVLHNIETYSVERFGVGGIGVLNTTGPVPYTEAIAPLLQQHPHHLARTNQQLGFLIDGIPGGYKNTLYNDKYPHYSQLSDPIVL